MNFLTIIKAVGTGIKGNRDLSSKEMEFAIKSILDQDATPAQIGAFLVGLRVKLESDIELLSAYETLKKSIQKEFIPDSIEIGYSADGKTKTPYLFYLSAFDIPNTKMVINQGNLKPAKNGILFSDLKSAIVMPENIYFFNLSKNAQQYENLSYLRNELGLRTIFNTIEKLLFSTQSRFGIVGMFHSTYFKKYKALYGKQYERLVIVQGDEGTPEIVKDCKIMVIDNDEITQEIKIKLEDFGINYERSKELISRDKMAYDLKYPKEDFIKLAKLNTALLLLASKQTNNIQQTFKKLISI
jgi:anthranilate phosphoribosyltransferase